MDRYLMDKDNSGRNEVDWAAVNDAMADIFKPPKGLAERIKAAVEKEAAVEKSVPEISVRRPSWYTSRLRYAAAAAVVAILAALAVSLGILSRREPPTMVAVKTYPVKSYRLDTPLVDGKSEKIDAAGSMPVRYAGVSSVSGSSVGSTHHREHIAPAVRHVWIVSDIDAADALLKRIAEENSKNISAAEKKSGKVVYSIGLKDTELQNLVNLLHGEGWSLVTPDYPQPSEEGNALFTGRGVNYEMCLVGK